MYMDTLPAICPECKKQITINTSEIIEVCQYCNKPVRTSDALLLYRYQKTMEGNSKFAVGDEREKFYSIIDKDYELAKDYFVSYVSREYPKLYDEKLLYYYFYFIGAKDTGTSTERVLLETIRGIKDRLEYVREINPAIADMYYKLLCTYVNRLLMEKGKSEFMWGLRGELPYLKLHLGDVASRLKKPDNFKMIVDKYRYLQGKEFDDDYILYVIEGIDRYYAFSKYQDELVDLMAAFLSVDGRSSLPSRRKKINGETDFVLLSARKKLAERMVPFWQAYIALLKEGKIAQAQRHLNMGNGFAYTDEVKRENSKFKRGFFKLKYKGDIADLNAQELAEKDVKNVKYHHVARFKRGRY